jgi:hypothetical protein
MLDIRILGFSNHETHLTLNGGIVVLAIGILCLLLSLNSTYGKFRKNPFGGLGLILTAVGVLIIIYVHYYSPYSS